MRNGDGSREQARFDLVRRYALVRAIHRSEMTPTERCIATALVDHADDRGRCYPSTTTLARWASVGRRRVVETLRLLRAIGLGVHVRSGRSTVYDVVALDPSLRARPVRLDDDGPQQSFEWDEDGSSEPVAQPGDFSESVRRVSNDSADLDPYLIPQGSGSMPQAQARGPNMNDFAAFTPKPDPSGINPPHHGSHQPGNGQSVSNATSGAKHPNRSAKVADLIPEGSAPDPSGIMEGDHKEEDPADGWIRDSRGSARVSSGSGSSILTSFDYEPDTETHRFAFTLGLGQASIAAALEDLRRKHPTVEQSAERWTTLYRGFLRTEALRIEERHHETARPGSTSRYRDQLANIPMAPEYAALVADPWTGSR